VRHTLTLLGMLSCSPFSKAKQRPEQAGDSGVIVDSADTAEEPVPDIRSWQGTRALSDPDAAPGVRYGYALAALDSNGDGKDELFVDAYKSSSHGEQAGQVWRYTELLAEAKQAIDPPGPRELQRFGRRLIAVGDADGDGYDDLGVVALGDDAEGHRAGAVYLLYGSADGPDRDRDVRLTSSEPARERE